MCGLRFNTPAHLERHLRQHQEPRQQGSTASDAHSSSDDEPWVNEKVKILDRQRKREFYKNHKSPKWRILNCQFLEAMKKVMELQILFSQFGANCVENTYFFSIATQMLVPKDFFHCATPIQAFLSFPIHK